MKIFNFKIIYINVIVFIFFYLVLETLTGSYIFSTKLKCNYILCNKNLAYQNTLYSPYQDIFYKKDVYGFRGRLKDVNKIDIIVVGGSTTDERYLNINDTWTEKLQNKLNIYNDYNIDIVNAGIDGQSTHGHIWNFKFWFNKIPNLKTKYIIFYIGINEKPIPTKSDNFSYNLNFIQKIKYFLKNNHGITYKIYSLYKTKIDNKLLKNVGHFKRDEDYMNDMKLVKDSSKILINENHRKILLENMNILINLSNKFGAKPIFITQRTNNWIKKNKKIYSLPYMLNKNNLETSNHYAYEKFVSDIVMSNCKRKNIFCINLFEKLKLNINDTYDFTHVNPDGSSKVSNVIFENLKNYVIFN
tara:strand:- start:213 stop:1286 length:1074 start_codon:yes stop_codon:yes gene_type:complete